MPTIYVSPTGSDSAAGTEAAPLKTIPAALGKARPGDDVVVRPGTYSGGTIYMPAGAEGREIRLISETPRAAKLRTSDFAVIRMANYTTVEGFDLQGPNHGIFNEGVHHITMRGNFAHDCGNSGMGAMHSDFVTIEGNECARCASLTWDSGISVYQPWSLTGDNTTKLRIVVRDNVCHDNITAPQSGLHTDGNGIIMDDFRNLQNGSPQSGKYEFGFLVENNLCYGNGGKGIQIAWSNNGVVRRNTVIGNNRDSANWGTDPLADLSSQDSHGNRYEGNLAVADRSLRASHAAIGYNYGSTKGQFVGNATWAGTPGDGAVMKHNAGDAGTWTDNLLGVDPKLVDYAPTNPALANIGWRSSGYVPTPIPEPEPEPEPQPQTSPFAAKEPAAVESESQAYELGTKVRISSAGRITGLRLYRTNTTAQPMRLWRGGAVVAQASIPGGTGWAEAAVDVAVAAGDELIVSTSKASAQKYPCDAGALSAEVRGDGFTIPAAGGVFSTTRGAMPTQAWDASYYWTDIRMVADTVADPDPVDPHEAEIESLKAQLAAFRDWLGKAPT